MMQVRTARYRIFIARGVRLASWAPRACLLDSLNIDPVAASLRGEAAALSQLRGVGGFGLEGPWSDAGVVDAFVRAVRSGRLHAVVVPNMAPPVVAPFATTSALAASGPMATPVGQWSLGERLFTVVTAAIPKLPGEFAETLRAMFLTVEGLAMMVGFLGLEVAAHVGAAPVALAADVILAGALVALGGLSALRGASELSECLVLIQRAQVASDLDAAAEKFATGMLHLGIAALSFLGARAVARRAAGRAGDLRQAKVSDDVPITGPRGDGVASEQGGRNATGFRGSDGFEMKNASYQPVRNTPGEVNGRLYSGHAFDQMQNRGISPSVVDNTVQNGEVFETRPGTIGHYDPVNRIRVIANATTGRVVTVMRGAP